MRAKRLAAAALLAIACLAPRAASPQTPPAPYALLGQHVPRFSAPLAGGGVLTDEQLSGKWIVAEFWGLWCEDSMADLSHAEALANAIAQDPKLAFVTVHVDPRYGRWKSVEDFMREEGTRYPIALDPQRDVMRAFQVSGTPTYLVIDPGGYIRALHRDLRKSTDPDGGVKALIKEIAAMRLDDSEKKLKRF